MTALAMSQRIPNREAAGSMLAKALMDFRGRHDAIVLALPRGGVPVAFCVAQQLQLPLDLMLVRKLGVPQQEELAMGAIASGDVQVLNDDVIAMHAIDEVMIADVAARESIELQRREHVYRNQRPRPALKNKTVILVDDGLATGSTMRAAIRAVRLQGAAQVIVAVPVAPEDTLHVLRNEADRVICPLIPNVFYAIGQWYDDFRQINDSEVLALLQRAWQGEAK